MARFIECECWEDDRWCKIILNTELVQDVREMLPLATVQGVFVTISEDDVLVLNMTWFEALCAFSAVSARPTPDPEAGR